MYIAGLCRFGTPNRLCEEVILGSFTGPALQAVGLVSVTSISRGTSHSLGVIRISVVWGEQRVQDVSHTVPHRDWILGRQKRRFRH